MYGRVFSSRLVVVLLYSFNSFVLNVVAKFSANFLNPLLKDASYFADKFLNYRKINLSARRKA